jgi:hypothetical protein
VRYEHCAVIAKRRQERVMIVMFGASEDSVLGDIWSLDLKDYKWTCLETRGKTPSPRALHNAVVTNHNGKDRIYIFGGGQSNNVPVDDDGMYCLDVGTLAIF